MANCLCALCVKKRKRAHTKPVLPYFKSLGDEAAAQKDNLIDKMFNVTIDSFLPSGELRVVLEQFALALLRHDAETRRVLGPANRISSLLDFAAQNAKIHDSRFPPDPSLPRMHPSSLIKEWGRIIQADYERRLAISCREAEGRLDTAVAPLHAGMSRMESMMEKLLNNQDRILNENSGLKAEVQVLRNRIDTLQAHLHYANQRLHSIDNGSQRISNLFKSPDKVVSSSQVEPPPPLDLFDTELTEALHMGASAPPEESMKPSAASATLERTASQASSTTLPLPPSTVEVTKSISTWNSMAEEFSSEKNRDKDTQVVDLLYTLRRSGIIYQQPNNISKIILPDWICKSGNKCYFRYCLEFIQFIAASKPDMASYISEIANRSTDDTAVLTAAAEVAKMCFDCIVLLDGKEVRRRTVLALGARVRDYKTEIATAQKNLNSEQRFSAESVQLVWPEVLARLRRQGAPGTPDGNKSIRKFAKAKMNKKND